MSDHPRDLYADFVDGALEPADRARVELHLAACPPCREEIDLALAGRHALDALPELPAPEGLTLEVRRRARRPRRMGTGAWAAAAAVVLAGAVVVVGVRAIQDRTAHRAAPVPAPAEEAPAEEALEEEADPGAPARDAEGRQETPNAAEFHRAFAEGGPAYRESDADRDPAGLDRLGRRWRDVAREAIRAGYPPTFVAYARAADPDAFPQRVRTALECLAAEVPPEQPVAPFTIEASRLQGTPVYVAGVLRGPASDQPFDRLLMWVVDRETCSLRYYASLQI